ncbi:bifunctional DNA primase/polymerase [Microbacterium sp. B35-04]|uniref:bifunctional DNA primase/polymerase n=1 Tax=Microbacterium sp. B35-04 TaxID=1961716 RepID=UPI00195316FD|nr:bifunctional DNA primase/polymerase [Microbacterium sp. B35-04]
MLRHALELAEAGWRVIPLNGKVPVIEDWPNEATTDPAVIREWWAGEDWNIGARIPDNHVVIDIDPQNGGSLGALERLAGVKMPPTMSIRSGRGSGSVHLHYLRPFPKTTKVRMPPGVDVLTNAQVVMPPSIHPATGNRYRWGDNVPVARLPLEVVSLIKPKPYTPRPGGRSVNISALVGYVRNQPRGQRHDAYHWAVRRAIEHDAPERQIRKLIEAAEDLGFTPQEARRIVDSVRKATA